MFSYVCLGSNNLERSTSFYDATLGVLGITRCTAEDANWENWVGWGIYEHGGLTELALWVCAPFDHRRATSGNGVMVALKARTWLEVQTFHAAALAHGGTSEGAPGLRPHYGKDFYVAYVRDPDGNKLAAVCRGFKALSRTPPLLASAPDASQVTVRSHPSQRDAALNQPRKS